MKKCGVTDNVSCHMLLYNVHVNPQFTLPLLFKIKVLTKNISLLCVEMRPMPPPWPTIRATATNTFSLRATTSSSSNPTHTFHKQLQPISTPSPSTFGVCEIFRPLYLPSSYLLCTNLIQPDWAWEKQIKPGRFYPDLTLWLDHHQEVLSSTSLTPLFSNLWLIFREAWWDEPDHELVIGYNCPRSHCTDFTKSFSPATGASLPQMGTEAKPEQSQGSKLASQGTERSLEGQKAKARPPDLSWCGLQFVGRTPWQTEGDGSATLPTAAAAPTRTWVHTGR